MSTILVIDDDPDIRGLVEYKLLHAGMNVFTENDGESGLGPPRSSFPISSSHRTSQRATREPQLATALSTCARAPEVQSRSQLG